MNTPLPPVPVPGSDWTFAAPARWLHWLSALLIFALLGVGWYMMAIEDDPGSDWFFAMHKSFGLVFLLVIVVRLAWRLGHRPAALPASVPGWQQRGAALIQWLLYGAMLAMPLLGLTGALYSEHGVALFGWPLPAWVQPDHDRAEQWFELHGTLAVLLAILIGLHVLAALKHRLIDRDQVFQRMG